MYRIKQPLKTRRRRLRPRHGLYIAFSRGAHFQEKLRSQVWHLDFQNIFQNRLCRKSCYEVLIKFSGGVCILKISKMYSFTGA